MPHFWRISVNTASVMIGSRICTSKVGAHSPLGITGKRRITRFPEPRTPSALA
jgi:hypothetical protein